MDLAIWKIRSKFVKRENLHIQNRTNRLMAKQNKPQRTFRKKKVKQLYEGNAFDKIFKENAESIFIPIVEEYLGIKIKSFKHLKEKMQVTLEREMDFFYEVETEQGERLILHIEFQTEDDPEILYRKGEYHGIQLRRKKMTIRHLVIYLGKNKPTMPTKLPENEIYRGFDLINIHEFNREKLLSSQIPGVIITAILTQYPEEQVESILRFIVMRLKIVCQNASELSKYLNQLVMLSRLRKIEELTIKITQEMPITYNIETDYLYQQGIEKGVKQGVEKGVEKGMEKGIEKGKHLKDTLLVEKFVTTQVLLKKILFCKLNKSLTLCL